MSSDQLTLLMPLKGRHLHTLRFLWHAERCKLPYPILIADGEVHPTIARLLANPATFPNLRYTHVKYPDDASFGIFLRKMLDAIGRIQTPYVMIVDNDDFVAPAGIAACLKLLEERPQYGCCSGSIDVFELGDPTSEALRRITGRIGRYEPRYLPLTNPSDLAEDAVAERVVTGFMNNWMANAVYRRDVLHTIWQDIVRIDFVDFYLIELFRAMRTLTLTRAYLNTSAVSYLRQYETSLRTLSKRDWVHQLLSGRFTNNAQEMIEHISAAAATADKVDAAPVAGTLFGVCGDWLYTFLTGEQTPEPAPAKVEEPVAGPQDSAAESTTASPPAAETPEPAVAEVSAEPPQSVSPRPSLAMRIVRRAYRDTVRLTSSLKTTATSPQVEEKPPAAEAPPAEEPPPPDPVTVAREVRSADLRAAGAAEDYVETFAGELAGIEAVLTGEAFTAFLFQYAPDLVPAPQRDTAATKPGTEAAESGAAKP